MTQFYIAVLLVTLTLNKDSRPPPFFVQIAPEDYESYVPETCRAPPLPTKVDDKNNKWRRFGVSSPSIFFDKLIAGEEECNSGDNHCLYDKMLASMDKNNIDQCFKETGVTPEDIRSAIERKTYGEKQMCFQKCLAMKTGSLESDGRINLDRVKERLTPELAKNSEAIIACLKKLGPVTACQHMAGVRKCMHN